MPIFEYLCDDCGNKFEKLVRRAAEAARAAGYDAPTQPNRELAPVYRAAYERYRRYVAAHLPLTV